MIKKQVQDIVQKTKDCTWKQIYYISSGESLGLLEPSKYIADREAKDIAIEIYTASEFRYRKPVALSVNSLVILCSNETADILEAARFAKEKQAITVGICNRNDAALESLVDYSIVCETDLVKHSEYSALYLLTTGILQLREPDAYPHLYKGMTETLEYIDDVCQKASIQFKENIAHFADANRGKQIYAIASGSNYSQAYYLSQNQTLYKNKVHVKAIHAGDFIHYSREAFDKEDAFIFFLGLDATREVEERALSVVEKTNSSLLLLDASEIDFLEIERAFTKVMPPLVFSQLMEMYVRHIAEEIESSV